MARGCGFSVLAGIFLVYALFNLVALVFIPVALASPRVPSDEGLAYLGVRLVLAGMWTLWFAFSSCRDRTIDSRLDCVDLTVLLFILASFVYFVVLVSVNAARYVITETYVCGIVDGVYFVLFLVAECLYLSACVDYAHDTGLERGTLVGRALGEAWQRGRTGVGKLGREWSAGACDNCQGCCDCSKSSSTKPPPPPAPMVPPLPSGPLLPGAEPLGPSPGPPGPSEPPGPSDPAQDPVPVPVVQRMTRLSTQRSGLLKI